MIRSCFWDVKLKQTVVTNLPSQRAMSLIFLGTFFSAVLGITFQVYSFNTNRYSFFYEPVSIVLYLSLFGASVGITGGMCFGGVGGAIEGGLAKFVKGLLGGALLGMIFGAISSLVVGLVLLELSSGNICAEYLSTTNCFGPSHCEW